MQKPEKIQEVLDETLVDFEATLDGHQRKLFTFIKACQALLKMVDSDNRTLVLPGVEPKMQSQNGQAKTGLSNKEIFEQVLRSVGPMKAKDVWAEAERRGAHTQASNPTRNTDSILREMVGKGRIRQIGPGLFAAKEEAQVRP